nr:PREDICTED: uncharacterized protein LOC106705590 [Latimeria chalumnae]|eukprot:XP_014350809.1 PREDICTED: uncharacterized protein LOC106705590 [Latimeria chalumnae]
MGSWALRNRERQLRELFGGRASSPTPSGSSRHQRVTESDPSNPMHGETQSASGHESPRRGKVASKASRKSFSKHLAPASSALAPMSRAASEPRQRGTPEAPALDGSGKAPVFLESEPEVYSETMAPRTPDPSPRRKSSKTRVVSGPTQSDLKKSHRHGSSRSRRHTPRSEETMLGPLLWDILARLNSLRVWVTGTPRPTNPRSSVKIPFPGAGTPFAGSSFGADRSER